MLGINYTKKVSKVLIINQSTYHPGYSAIDLACKNTWGKTDSNDVKIINYYGNMDSIDGSISCNRPVFSKTPGIYGNDLIVNTYDLYVTPGGVDHTDFRPEKQILAMEHCVNNFEFEFLYKTNCVSYIDINNLLKYINGLANYKTYTGSVWEENGPNPGFCSGNNVIMSRDVVEVAVKHKDDYLRMHNKYKTNKAEDVMMGSLLVLHLDYLNKLKRNIEAEQYDLRHRKFDEVYNKNNIFNYLVFKDQSNLLYKIHEARSNINKL